MQDHTDKLLVASLREGNVHAFETLYNRYSTKLYKSISLFSYDKSLATLVEVGIVPMSLVDNAVRRILRLKFRLGLFENPYTPGISEEKCLVLPEHVDIARQLAEEFMVLHKNENHTLPLKNVSKIAVIGPMAKEKDHLPGFWYRHSRGRDVESI